MRAVRGVSDAVVTFGRMINVIADKEVNSRDYDFKLLMEYEELLATEPEYRIPLFIIAIYGTK